MDWLFRPINKSSQWKWQSKGLRSRFGTLLFTYLYPNDDQWISRLCAVVVTSKYPSLHVDKGAASVPSFLHVLLLCIPRSSRRFEFYSEPSAPHISHPKHYICIWLYSRLHFACGWVGTRQGMCLFLGTCVAPKLFICFGFLFPCINTLSGWWSV